MIVLVRHAAAVDEGPDLRDEQRFLTRDGRAAARALAAELAAAGVAIERVVTSPLVRAVQTAEVVLHALGLDLVVEAEPLLAPGGSIRLAASRLDGFARARAGGSPRAIVAVGHEPSISGLAGALVDDASFPSMRKAEACLIEDGAVRGWMGSDRRG